MIDDVHFICEGFKINDKFDLKKWHIHYLKLKPEILEYCPPFYNMVRLDQISGSRLIKGIYKVYTEEQRMNIPAIYKILNNDIVNMNINEKLIYVSISPNFNSNRIDAYEDDSQLHVLTPDDMKLLRRMKRAGVDTIKTKEYMERLYTQFHYPDEWRHINPKHIDQNDTIDIKTLIQRYQKDDYDLYVHCHNPISSRNIQPIVIKVTVHLASFLHNKQGYIGDMTRREVGQALKKLDEYLKSHGIELDYNRSYMMRLDLYKDFKRKEPYEDYLNIMNICHAKYMKEGKRYINSFYIGNKSQKTILYNKSQNNIDKGYTARGKNYIRIEHKINNPHVLKHYQISILSLKTDYNKLKKILKERMIEILPEYLSKKQIRLMSIEKLVNILPELLKKHFKRKIGLKTKEIVDAIELFRQH